VPVVPVCLLEPLWVQLSALLPERPLVVPTRPLGCHRPRISDRVVFDQVIAATVHGSGYERIASPGCSDGTIRRRLKEWAALGLSEQVHVLALRAYDRMIGLELDELAVDGCITKAPGGGEVAGRSPVDRGKRGLKRSVLTEGAGLPLHLVSAGANRHDNPLLAPTLAGLDKLDGPTEDATLHLDRAYDSRASRALLDELGLHAAIARKGVPAPVQAGARWVVERTHSWMNGYGKLRRCTEKHQPVVDFYLFLAAALVVLRQLIQRARLRYRWATCPPAASSSSHCRSLQIALPLSPRPHAPMPSAGIDPLSWTDLIRRLSPGDGSGLRTRPARGSRGWSGGAGGCRRPRCTRRWRSGPAGACARSDDGATRS